jgi:hypothetical protein
VADFLVIVGSVNCPGTRCQMWPVKNGVTRVMKQLVTVLLVEILFAFSTVNGLKSKEKRQQ